MGGLPGFFGGVVCKRNIFGCIIALVPLGFCACNPRFCVRVLLFVNPLAPLKLFRSVECGQFHADQVFVYLGKFQVNVEQFNHRGGDFGPVEGFAGSETARIPRGLPLLPFGNGRPRCFAAVFSAFIGFAFP